MAFRREPEPVILRPGVEYPRWEMLNVRVVQVGEKSELHRIYRADRVVSVRAGLTAALARGQGIVEKGLYRGGRI